MKRFTFLIATFILLISINANAQWVKMSSGMGTDTIVGSLSVIGNNIFAGTPSNGVYLSTNNGTSWAQTTLNSYIESLTSLGNNIFAGTESGGVYISTNNGTTWTQTSLGNLDVLGLTTLENNIFAGIALGGAYLTTNNGATWTSCGLNGQSVYTFAKINNNLFAGRKNDGVYLSTNNGTLWTQTSLNNRTVHALATIGTTLFAGSDSGVFISTSNGTNWTQTTLNNKYIYSLAVSGTFIFAGATNGGVYLSTNNGTSWIQKNQGFSNNIIVAPIIITPNYIYAGTYGQSLWRRSFAEIIGIKNISTEIPSNYSLSQNYPNPFNPSTIIRFQLSVAGRVSLKVFDMLGKEVATLVNESLQPGTYETAFDASALSSGIYFYTLASGEYRETKRMTLIK